MADIREHASPPVPQVPVIAGSDCPGEPRQDLDVLDNGEIGETPHTHRRARRSHVQGGRMCAMLLFNAVVAGVSLYLFLSWSNVQLPAFFKLSDSRQIPGPSTMQSDGTSPRQVITPEVSELAERLMKQGNVPGLSVGVVRWTPRQPADVEFGSWGVMSEHGANVTADTLFNIGSCSKAFLALSMGILMEDFRFGANKTALPPGLTEFSWDTPIIDLLPEDEWGLANEWATKEANIGDILSHVSGLPRHDFAWGYNDSTLDIVKRLRHLKTTHGLRQEWDYNNQMYILGAHIISRYAGVSYTQYATEHIFHVLGMNATTFEPAVAERSGNLSDAWSYTGRRIPLWFGSGASEMLAGPGGIISSARDMTKWISAIVARVTDLHPTDGAIPSLARPLSEVTRARAIVYGRSSLPGSSILGYGMGWMRFTYLGHELLFHSGAIPGYRAIVILLPRERAGVVVLANSDDNILAVHNAVAFNLVHSILGLPLTSQPPQVMGTPGYTGVIPPPSAFRDDRPSGSEDQQVAFDAPGEPSSLEAYAGTYTNAGYGNLTLCTPSTASAYCDRVRGAFSLVHDAVDASAPALLGEWPRLLASHVRLVPRSLGFPHAFSLTTHYIFPEGYGEDRSPFDYQLFPPGLGLSVACVGVGDTPWGREAGKGCGVSLTPESHAYRKEGIPLRQVADVWFEKVE